MGLKSAEQVILFDFFFIFLISLYGIGSGAAGISLANFQYIAAPQLAPLPVLKACAGWDFVCQGAKDITQATAYVGWVLYNVPVIVVYFLSIIIAYADLIMQISFSPTFNENGVPLLGFIFLALQVIVLFEVFRLFRGSASGM